MKRSAAATAALVSLVAVALVAISPAGADHAPKGSPKQSATPVFRLMMKPQHEVPRVRGLHADAVGSVTFDLERNSAGAITAGEVVFYVNYAFPGSTTITGLHIHEGTKKVSGPVVISSGVTTFTDADGRGNITTVVSASPSLLQAILDNPRNYYVNLHTTVHPGGALRDQLHNPKKR